MFVRGKNKLTNAILLIMSILIFMNCSMGNKQYNKKPTVWQIIVSDTIYYEFYVDKEKQIYFDGMIPDALYDSEVESDSNYSSYLKLKEQFFACENPDSTISTFTAMLKSSPVWKNFIGKSVFITPVDSAIFNPKQKENINFEYLDFAIMRYSDFRNRNVENDSGSKVHIVEEMDTVIEINH